jgi:hypothetical protein
MTDHGVLYLSRRNLNNLLNKLDINKRIPGSSLCTLTKEGSDDPRYEQSPEKMYVIAVEDEDYYETRQPSPTHWFPLEVEK